jgi:glycosyltransferase involved in cell wall biosynthesis
MNPLLSVLMTSYNREQYIPEAIESILASSYTNFELIIVDDGSKDRTVEIARSYAQKDQRIKVYVNEKNLGDYRNRNQAASYATGDYLMYVDSDDRILPDGFERCVQVMKEFPNAGFGIWVETEKTEAFYMTAKDAIRQHFFARPMLSSGPGAMILKRSFFEQIGAFPVKYGPANDMYFNLKAASAAGVVFIPFIFHYYRIHAGQELNNKYSYLYNNFNYLRDALQELELPLSEKEKEWMMNKNRRRFLMNCFNFCVQLKNIPKAFTARKLADFGLRDAWKALVHPSL